MLLSRSCLTQVCKAWASGREAVTRGISCLRTCLVRCAAINDSFVACARPRHRSALHVRLLLMPVTSPWHPQVAIWFHEETLLHYIHCIFTSRLSSNLREHVEEDIESTWRRTSRVLENSVIRCVRGCVPILRGEKEKGNDRKNDRKKDRDGKRYSNER